MPTKFTDANFPLHIRTLEAVSNVTVTGKPLDKQIRMVSQSGFTRAAGAGGCVCVCLILQEMACPAECAGSPQFLGWADVKGTA